MISRAFALLGAVLGLLAAAPLPAQVEMPEPNWSLPAAQAAARSNEISIAADRLRPLFERARAGQEQALLVELQAIAIDDQLPLPARERLLHGFAQGLGDLPPGSAGPAVLQFLLSYQPHTLVPHPDNALVGTPLYNIRAAAAGSLNEWRRQAGYDAARTAFAQPDEDAAAGFLADYRTAATPRRRGLEQALPLASAEQLRQLAGNTVPLLPEDAGLTPLAARSALAAGATGLLQQALVTGSGPDVAGLLEDAAESLDEPDRIGLLFVLIDAARPVNATLAIAALAPGLLHRPEIADRLFGLLDDPGLGGAAALALSASERAEVLERLSQLAAADRGLPSRRAAVALGVARQTDAGGAR